jgi:hypothetical protein
MNRILLGLHIASMVIACCLVGLSQFVYRDEIWGGPPNKVIGSAITLIAGTAQTVGLILMVKRDRQGQRVGIGLTISTIAACFLMCLSVYIVHSR